MRTFSTSLLVLAASLGCSPAPEGSSSTITLDTLPTETATAFCHVLFSCPVNGDAAGFRLLFGDEATCRANYIRSIGASFTDLVSLARAGSVRFDPAAARRCFDGIVSACSLRNSGPACDTTFVGTVAIGGACRRQEQCAGDAYCDTGSGPTCPGTCRARVALGAACTSSTQCTRVGVQGNAVCSFDAMNSRCVDQRETFTAAVGQPCDSRSRSGNVETSANCQSGLVCDHSAPAGMPTPEVGTCRAPIAVGAACSPTGTNCAGPAQCRPTAPDLTTGTCQAITVQNAAGQPCDTSRLCNPLRYLVCRDGTCQSSGTGAVGTPCAGDIGALICNAGLYCDTSGTARTCQPKLAVGMPCSSSEACVSGACSGEPRVCQMNICR